MRRAIDTLMAVYGRLPAAWRPWLRRWLVLPAKRLLSYGVIPQDGFVLRRRLDQAVVLQLLRAGAYEPELSALLRQILRPGDVFIDIGANIGYFSLLGAASVGSTGQVHCFEPNPTTYAVLADNIRLNGFTQVHAQPLALSNEAGPIQLWYGPGIDSGLASLRQTHALLTTQVAGRAETLDWYSVAHHLGKIRAMKLDVEGAEPLVLQGARAVLTGPRRPDLIALEFNRAHLAAFQAEVTAGPKLLTDLGYQLYELLPAAKRAFELRALAPGALPADGTLVASAGPHLDFV